VSIKRIVERDEAPARRGLAARLWRDEAGVVAIMFALMFPVLAAMVALGIDVGFWYSAKRGLQNAADAAAVAGGHELRLGNSTTVAESTALQEATRNGFDSGTGTITVSSPPGSGSYTGSSLAVEVSLSNPGMTFFSQLVMDFTPTINARAVAILGSDSDACVLALSGTVAKAVSASGNPAIVFDGCQVASNSSAANAIYVGGSATLEADCATTVGGVSGDLDLDCSSAATGTRAVDDPYADLPSPTITGCDETGYSVNSGGSEAISPGTYCNGFTIRGGGEVTLAAGTYVIDGGSFKINGGGILTGSNVTFIFANGATADVAGGAEVTLSASTTGDYAGIVFFQDEDTVSGTNNKFNGGSTMSINGAMYFPSQDVEFTGGASIGGPDCTLIVAQSVGFGGNANLQSDCDGLGGNTVDIYDSVELVE
jgi:Flp pilus assembly protein TadG